VLQQHRIPSQRPEQKPGNEAQGRAKPGLLSPCSVSLALGFPPRISRELGRSPQAASPARSETAAALGEGRWPNLAGSNSERRRVTALLEYQLQLITLNSLHFA